MEVPSITTQVTMTLGFATKVHAMPIQPYSRENNIALQQIVLAIASSIIYAGVLSGT